MNRLPKMPLPLVVLATAWALTSLAQSPSPPPKYEAYTGKVLETSIVQIMDANEAPFAFLSKITAAGATPSVASLTTRLDEAAKRISPRPMPISRAANRMPMPQVLIGPEIGLEAGLDNDFLIPRLAISPEEALVMVQYVLTWFALVQCHPDEAFARMAARSKTPEVSSLDVLHLTGVLKRDPGNKLTRAPSKRLWEELYHSSNPVYRLFALEKFDSLEQSPAEWLSLYRECLFGGCSYLELRALEAIVRNQDLRPEVAQRLEEYLASHPPVNDGSLPVMAWKQFPSLAEGAKRVIATIRNGDSKGKTQR